MLRLLIATLLVAILVGYLTGGQLGRLAGTSFRLPWVGLAGVALQFLPLTGRLGDIMLVLSFFLLVITAVANRRLPGFVLIVVGLGMNVAVITVNHGMPVDRDAIVASGQADTLPELEASSDAKHHLMTSEDRLVLLADVIAIPPPIRQAVSVGDLAAIAGAMWFVIGAMHGIGGSGPAREPEPTVEATRP